MGHMTIAQLIREQEAASECRRAERRKPKPAKQGKGRRCARQPTGRPASDAMLAVLRAIVRAVKGGCPPTIRSLMHDMDYRSPNAIVGHLDALEARGYIEPRPIDVQSRNIRLVGAKLTLAYEDSEAGRRLRDVVEGEP